MHLLAAITANGFGHAVQTGAVVAALRRRVYGLRVTLRSALPRARLAEVIAEPFDLHPVDHDFGVVIRSASELDLPATVAAYRALTARWDALIGQEDDAIRAAGADLVLANASVAALAGARAAGVACAGIVTVNWADILAG
ncbi:MAG TPA: hypothetical protein VK943_13430, partial [Arenibaculum sp.]|nr:hypothetical protein [Arenibaculum sp.]